jgi:heme-degrading monooxygenase HmoA
MYRYIWKIKLKDGVSEQVLINHWRQSSTILQEFEGALGTHLHRTRGEERCYFAVAEWESQAARDTMMADVNTGDSERSKRWLKFAKNDDFGVVDPRFAGEEIGVVLPEK